ncbi:hypothetical protein HDE_01560 [Halotydeus destructor]|nr:hypothetical protein HDE_01560 [Halotydeus destructor]
MVEQLVSSSRKSAWIVMHLTLCLLVLALIAVVRVKTDQLVDCDYDSFPGAGCLDQLTTRCDYETKKCICIENASFELRGQCLPFKNIHEQCQRSEQCHNIGGKCINRHGLEVSHDSLNGLDESKSLEYFCQCPEGSHYNYTRKRCEKNIVGKKCTFDAECPRANVHCDDRTSKCRCSLGFYYDTTKDTCDKPDIDGPFVISSKDILTSWDANCNYGYIYDSQFHRCISIERLHGARSWSSFVWKIAVLCIVLVLMMMLINGVQRARVNENLIQWQRTVESYNGREFSGYHHRHDPDISRRRTANELRLALAASRPPLYTSHVTNLPADSPPSYEEAIGTNSTSNVTTIAIPSSTRTQDISDIGPPPALPARNLPVNSSIP